METGILEKLFIWGCDTDEALQRLVGDEELYLSFILRYCVDEDIDKLDKLIAAKEAKEAHSLAHTMKGVYGNLGIVPVYDILSDIVGLLKNGNVDAAGEMMPGLRDVKAELDDIVKKGENA